MFNTGIFYKDRKVISHRSILKIFINPLLRSFFGKALGSNIKEGKFVEYKLINQKEPKGFAFKVNFDYDYKTSNYGILIP